MRWEQENQLALCRPWYASHRDANRPIGLKEVKSAFADYRREVESKKRADSPKYTQIDRAGKFVRLLDCDFEPVDMTGQNAP